MNRQLYELVSSIESSQVSYSQIVLAQSLVSSNLISSSSNPTSKDASTTFRLLLCVLIRIPKSFTNSFDENSQIYAPFSTFPEWFLHSMLQLLSMARDPVLIELVSSFLLSLNDSQEKEFGFLNGFDKVIYQTRTCIDSINGNVNESLTLLTSQLFEILILLENFYYTRMQDMLSILQSMSRTLGRDWKGQEEFLKSFLGFYLSCLSYFQGHLFINGDVLHCKLWDAFESVCTSLDTNSEVSCGSLQCIFAQAFQLGRFYPIPLVLYSRVLEFMESNTFPCLQQELKLQICIYFSLLIKRHSLYISPTLFTMFMDPNFDSNEIVDEMLTRFNQSDSDIYTCFELIYKDVILYDRSSLSTNESVEANNLKKLLKIINYMSTISKIHIIKPIYKDLIDNATLEWTTEKKYDLLKVEIIILLSFHGLLDENESPHVLFLGLLDSLTDTSGSHTSPSQLSQLKSEFYTEFGNIIGADSVGLGLDKSICFQVIFKFASFNKDPKVNSWIDYIFYHLLDSYPELLKQDEIKKSLDLLCLNGCIDRLGWILHCIPFHVLALLFESKDNICCCFFPPNSLLEFQNWIQDKMMTPEFPSLLPRIIHHFYSIHNVEFHTQWMSVLLNSNRQVGWNSSCIFVEFFSSYPMRTSFVDEETLQQEQEKVQEAFIRLIRVRVKSETNLYILSSLIHSLDPLNYLFIRDCLLELIFYLGNENLYLKSLSFSLLNSFIKTRQSSTSKLNAFEPFVKHISLEIIKNIENNPKVLKGFVKLLEIDIQSYFKQTLKYTLPWLVFKQDRDIIKEIASALGIEMAQMLIEEGGNILYYLLLQESRDIHTVLLYYLEISCLDTSRISLGQLFKSCQLQLISNLVLQLGDLKKSRLAQDALLFIKNQMELVGMESASNKRRNLTQNDNLSGFLMNHVLGILPSMNEIISGPFLLSKKIKTIHSLNRLIFLVGNPIVFSLNQIMASLQTMMKCSKKDTLECWKTLLFTIEQEAILPLVHSITMILVVSIDDYTESEVKILQEILDHLFINLYQKSVFLGFCDLPDHPRLSKYQSILSNARQGVSWNVRLKSLIESFQFAENSILLNRVLNDVYQLLLENQMKLSEYEDCQGLLQKLMHLSANHADSEIAFKAAECLGVASLMDSSRMEFVTPSVLFDYEKTWNVVDFACCFLNSQLIPEYSSALNVFEQSVYAFVLQEILSFCGFSTHLGEFHPDGSLAPHVSLDGVHALVQGKTLDIIQVEALISKWNQLVKKFILVPLLSSKYSIRDIPKKVLFFPVFSESISTAEWIKQLCLYLIQSLSGRSEFHVFFLKIIHLKICKLNFIPLLFPMIVSVYLVDASKASLEVFIQQILYLFQNDSSNVSLMNALFYLLDFLNGYLVYKSQFTMQTVDSKRSKSASSLKIRQESMESMAQIVYFLQQIPLQVLSDAAFASGAYTRSFLNFEYHMRLNSVPPSLVLNGMNPNAINPNAINPNAMGVSKMQIIYSRLDEPDGMQGLKISSPTIHQLILENMNLGKWDMALSCFEMKKVEELDLTYLELMFLSLKKLMNLNGMLSMSRSLMSHPKSRMTRIHSTEFHTTEWLEKKEFYINKGIEAAWRLSDWKVLEEFIQDHSNNDKKDNKNESKKPFDTLIGTTLFALYSKNKILFQNQMQNILKNSLISLSSLESKESNAFMQLQIYQEMKEVGRILFSNDNPNGIHEWNELSSLYTLWEKRLECCKPNNRELILQVRCALLDVFFGVSNLVAHETSLCSMQGNIFIKLAQECRKSKRMQAANVYILKALEKKNPCALFEKAKWIWDQGDSHQAMSWLKSVIDLDLTSVQEVVQESVQDAVIVIDTIIPNPHNKDSIKDTIKDKDKDKINSSRDLGKDLDLKAKMRLQHVRWTAQLSTLNSSSTVASFTSITRDYPKWEKASYFLGSYINQLYQVEKEKKNINSAQQTQLYNLALLVCKNYGRALTFGTHYLYQTLSRFLSLWLDLGQIILSETCQARIDKFSEIHKLVKKLSERLPAWQFLTAISQLISRICHKNPKVHQVLECIIQGVLTVYPQQTLWHLLSVSKSSLPIRAERISNIFTKIKSNPSTRHLDSSCLESLIQEARKLNSCLVHLCNFPVSGRDSSLSMSRDFKALNRMTPLRMIVPCQSSMTVSWSSNTANDFIQPFPHSLPTISKFGQVIEIMNSLQKPRKITIYGSDGKEYIFLCKPKDDLRKDARLMEFNSLINKLLQGDSESRKRILSIKTYAVIPLNEECGLIEWVKNTIGFRHILVKLYKSKNIYISPQQVKKMMDAGVKNPLDVFVKEILPKHPAVFHEWFREKFPDPCKWFQARLAYTRSVATMSMVGYVVGLGDRHGENILFDETNGKCVHVDLNCLFEKGQDFEIPERVPFRLTHNMVDAMGITGVEGVFRMACQVSLNVLRSNRASLMSVLETFLYDPLCEWSSRKKNGSSLPAQGVVGKEENGEVENELAVKSLKSIDKKLCGHMNSAGLPLSTEGQVDELILQATSNENLSRMYIGWAAFM